MKVAQFADRLHRAKWCAMLTNRQANLSLGAGSVRTKADLKRRSGGQGLDQDLFTDNLEKMGFALLVLRRNNRFGAWLALAAQARRSDRRGSTRRLRRGLSSLLDAD